MSTADDATRAALAEGNRAYEERFGHVFLIRASGRSPAEMLGELRRRLGNDEETERRETTRQLAQITALRVRGLVGATATAAAGPEGVPETGRIRSGAERAR